jgi:hypothetical protein
VGGDLAKFRQCRTPRLDQRGEIDRLPSLSTPQLLRHQRSQSVRNTVHHVPFRFGQVAIAGNIWQPADDLDELAEAADFGVGGERSAGPQGGKTNVEGDHGDRQGTRLVRRRVMMQVIVLVVSRLATPAAGSQRSQQAER